MRNRGAERPGPLFERVLEGVQKHFAKNQIDVVCKNTA